MERVRFLLVLLSTDPWGLEKTTIIYWKIQIVISAFFPRVINVSVWALVVSVRAA